MKWLIQFALMILIAIPAYAQDEGGGGFDGGASFGGGFDDGDLGGEGPMAAIQSAPKVDPLADLKSWLAKAAAPPIDKSQEKPLKSLYDKQVKELSKAFKAQFGVSLESAIAAQSPARGRRGGSASPKNPEHAAAITRLTNQLSDKVIAGLRIDQQAALRKYQSEQLRVREVSLLHQKLKAAGIFLSPEQDEKVDAVYARKSHYRTLVIIGAKGEPYDETMAILNKQTTQRIVQVLDATQIAMLSSANKPKTP